MESAQPGDLKRKLYWKVFYALTALTCFELVVVYAPFGKIVIALIIVCATLAKAFSVGWFYMHLNHETKGLKVVLLFPMFVAFFYAVYLITDAKFTQTRHSNVYVSEPKRFFGPRNLHEPKFDDFGNRIIEDAPIHNPKVEEKSPAEFSTGDMPAKSENGPRVGEVETHDGSAADNGVVIYTDKDALHAQSSASSEGH